MTPTPAMHAPESSCSVLSRLPAYPYRQPKMAEAKAQIILLCATAVATRRNAKGAQIGGYRTWTVGSAIAERENGR